MRLVGDFLDIEVLGIATEYAEGDRTYPDFAHAESGESGGIVVRAAEGRFVYLSQLGMVCHLQRLFGRHDMDGDAMLMLGVEIGEQVVGTGDHLEV